MRRRAMSIPQNPRHSETDISDASYNSDNEPYYNNYSRNANQRSNNRNDQMYANISDSIPSIPNATSTPIRQSPVQPRLYLPRDYTDESMTSQSSSRRSRLSPKDKQINEAVNTWMGFLAKDRNVKCGIGTVGYIEHDGILTRSKCHKLYGNCNESGNLDMSLYGYLFDPEYEGLNSNNSNSTSVSSGRRLRSVPSIESIGSMEVSGSSDSGGSLQESGYVARTPMNSRRMSSSVGLNSTQMSSSADEMSGLFDDNRRITRSMSRRLRQLELIDRSAQTDDVYSNQRSSDSSIASDTRYPNDISSTNSSSSSVFLDSNNSNSTSSDLDSTQPSFLTVTPIRGYRKSSRILSDNEVLAVVDGTKYFSVTETSINQTVGLLRLKTRK